MGTVAWYPSALNNAVSVQSTSSIFFTFSLNAHVSLLLSISRFLLFYVVRPEKQFAPFSLLILAFLWIEIHTERYQHKGCRPITTVVAHVRGGSCRYLSDWFIQSFSPLPHLIPMLQVCRRSWRWWNWEADFQLLFSVSLLCEYQQK